MDEFKPYQPNILIVDDTPQNLSVLHNMLTEHGYRVRPALNGELALKAVHYMLPDLILLDIMMPSGIDGYEVCRQLKADDRTRNIPVLFISALDAADDKVKAFEAGGVDYITKPFYVKEVIARVKTHLALREMQTRLQDQNTQLQREILERQHAEDILRIQRNLAVDLSTYTNITDAFQGILGHLLQVDGIDCGGIYLVDGSSGALDLVVHAGLSPEFIGVVSHYDADSPHARFVQAGKSMYQTYSELLPEPKDAVHRQEGLRATAVIPIAYEHRVIAVLNLASHIYDDIPASTRDVLETTAAQIGGIVTRIQAETRLQESWQNLQNLFDKLNDFLFILDGEGHILYVNPVVEKRLGYPLETLEQMHVLEVHPPDRRKEAATIVRDMIAGKTSLCPIPLMTKDGSLIPVETVVTHGVWNGQDVLFGISHDITERKKAEEELQQYATDLQEANAELAQYAYVVSHDLKAPLRAIHNYADFLEEDLDGCLDNEQQSYLNGLKKALCEADTLIDDILALSRLERHHTEIETLQSGEFLRALIDTLNLPDDVEIVMGDDWPTITIESVLFRQIFQNLIGNAVKFNTSTHKRVELGWQSVGQDRYEMFVRDNGIGIALSHQQKIFQIFERLHTKDEFDGTGIGLAIVKKAINKLGGTIRVESKPGQGSTFFLTFPAIP